MGSNTKRISRKTKRKTIKKSLKNRVWLFRKGNLVVSYKTPFLHIQKGKIGGAEGEETEKKVGKEFVENIKRKMESSKIGYTQKEYDAVEKLLNREDLCNIPGKLSSMASDVYNSLTKNAVSLGEFLTPSADAVEQQNESTIRVSWFPRSNLHYKRGNSTARDKRDFKMGDVVVNIEPEKYANTASYFNGMFGSVEDLFTDIIAGKRVPKKEHVIKTVSHQPQLDYEESTQSPIELNLKKEKASQDKKK